MEGERWQRALTENDKDFQKLFGIKKEVFLEALAVLTAAYAERHLRGGRKPKLVVGYPLLLTLQSWREYRTLKHLGYAFCIAKSTVSDTMF